MAEKKCSLELRSANCNEKDCDTCGWNPDVAEARNAVIAANGLTKGPDGLRRLIIKKEGEIDDSNT